MYIYIQIYIYIHIYVYIYTAERMLFVDRHSMLLPSRHTRSRTWLEHLLLILLTRSTDDHERVRMLYVD